MTQLEAAYPRLVSQDRVMYQHDDGNDCIKIQFVAKLCKQSLHLLRLFQ